MATEMRIAFDAYTDILPLAELKKSKFQRNKHPQDQIERLAKIMLEHGVRHPIHISKLTGQVCFGHGRWAAALLNGWDKFPIVYQEFKSEDEEYACVQSDNAIAHWAELDLASINTDLANLGPDFDIDLLGIKDFVLDPAEKFEAQCDEDEVPEHADTRCKRGDVWQLGRHRIMCGDSTAPGSWAAVRSDQPTMVFTSPPYGVGDGARLRQHYVPGADTPKTLYQDHDDNPDAWLQLMRDWTAMAITHADSVFCNVQMLANNKRDLITWLSEFGPHMVDIVIWDKGHGPPQMQKNILTNVFEFIFVLGKHANPNRTIPMADFHGSQSNMARVGGAKNNEFADIHKATMPVELVEWALNLAVGANHVIDPFGGTGTTMIAAEKLGRSCGVIELDPKYCDVILARWEKYTGKQAERIQTEEGTEEQGRQAKASDRPRSSKKASPHSVHNKRNGKRPKLQQRHARA